jgi:hypothetical protein
MSLLHVRPDSAVAVGGGGFDDLAQLRANPTNVITFLGNNPNRKISQAEGLPPAGETTLLGTTNNKMKLMLLDGGWSAATKENRVPRKVWFQVQPTS